MDKAIKLALRQVQDLKELQQQKQGEWVRRIGLVYFQQLGDGFIPRVITEATNGQWIKQAVKEGKIYVPKETVKAEMG